MDNDKKLIVGVLPDQPRAISTGERFALLLTPDFGTQAATIVVEGLLHGVVVGAGSVDVVLDERAPTETTVVLEPAGGCLPGPCDIVENVSFANCNFAFSDYEIDMTPAESFRLHVRSDPANSILVGVTIGFKLDGSGATTLTPGETIDGPVLCGDPRDDDQALDIFAEGPSSCAGQTLVPIRCSSQHGQRPQPSP
jgi:hypothetical protein